MQTIITTENAEIARAIVNALLPQWAFTLSAPLGKPLYIFTIPESIPHEVKADVLPGINPDSYTLTA